MEASPNQHYIVARLRAAKAGTGEYFDHCIVITTSDLLSSFIFFCSSKSFEILQMLTYFPFISSSHLLNFPLSIRLLGFKGVSAPD